MRNKTNSINIIMKNTEDNNTELIQRDEIEGTPFVKITLDNGDKFITLGQYRLTEKTKKDVDLDNWTKDITWNKIIQVMIVLDNQLKHKKG